VVVTGGKETHMLNKFMGEVTPELIDLLKPYMMDGILESFRISANEFFVSSGITYAIIFQCLTGSPNCPFVLPPICICPRN
jgi:hypothetical protein